MRDLVIGITLPIIAIGWVIASIARGGKKAWFIGKPFLEPTLPVVMIVALVDEFGLSGAVQANK